MDSLPERVVAGVVGAMLIPALGVAVVAGTRSPAVVDSGSPEATVQAYLDALLGHDHDRAAQYFVAFGACDAADLDAQSYVDRGARVELVERSARVETATVTVLVTTPSGGPVPNLLEEEVTFDLARADDEWALTGTPWPIYDCFQVGPR